MCIVGEWRGHTGDDALTALLLRDFTLLRRVALPNWTDTAHELTIWHRRAQHVAAVSVQTEQPHGSHDEAQLSGPRKAAEPVSVPEERSTADDGAARSPAGGTRAEAPARGMREPLQCWTCGVAPLASATGDADRGLVSQHETTEGRHELRRCRYCRDAAFCSAACAAEGNRTHRQAHALRLIFFDEHRPDFNNDVDYEAMPTLEAAD